MFVKLGGLVKNSQTLFCGAQSEGWEGHWIQRDSFARTGRAAGASGQNMGGSQEREENWKKMKTGKRFGEQVEARAKKPDGTEGGLIQEALLVCPRPLPAASGLPGLLQCCFRWGESGLVF